MWNRIKQINWFARWKDENAYLEAKLFILNSYSENECRNITAFVNDMHSALSEHVRKFEHRKKCTVGKYIGTDGFNDMIAQAISYGEAFYNNVRQDPTILNDMEFGESFMYCLPHNEDFEIRRKTNECVNDLNRIITESGNNPIIDDLNRRFKLMLSGKFKDATADLNAELYNNMRLFGGNDCNAKFANLIRDCNKFYVSY